MINWIYKGKDVLSHDDIPSNAVAFVYCLTFDDGMKYIGYKIVRSETITPSLKSLKLRPNATRVFKNILRDDNGSVITSKANKAKARKQGIKAKREPYDLILTNLQFVKYVGSSKENEGRVLVDKEILHYTSNRRTSTYLEHKLLFKYGAIEDDSTFTNKNIGGKHFDNCLDGLIKD